MNCIETYETGLLYHHYANTAYPLTPKSFMQYKLKDEDEIRDFVTQQWQKADELSLYIHIPFCKTRCKFCEYVVLENTDDDTENRYVELLIKEMQMYSEILRGKKIVGYDLGGGTPSKLSEENLRKITKAVNTLFDIQPGTVFSVETTPLIAANEPEKIRALYDMGYERISMGVQTVSEKLLSELGRDGSKSIYERAVSNIRQAGYKKFNIDLMYGFLHQTESDFDNTLRYAVGLDPEYITLYRNRYKGTKLEYEAGGVSIYKAMYQYRIAYRVLTENGYLANVGKNTFSRVENDYGTSDYLTKRVIDAVPYVGMGLGAQSFGPDYLAYNLGAAEKRMERYEKAINEGRLPFQDIYRLPLEETMAKALSVAFYFAFIDTASFAKRFSIDFRERFRDEIAFVLENSLMEFRGDRLYLTERGSDYINGVIPLFYSEHSKKELETAFRKQSIQEKTDEELFLSAYNIKNYERPSVATDIVLFSLKTDKSDNYRKADNKKLSVLLIKRGEHPFMNHWALPGGFLKPDETVEECALREIYEETNVTPETIIPAGIFSTPGRDPRGWIISSAFASVINEAKVKPLSGDDAIDTKWFTLELREQEKDKYTLELTSGNITLSAGLTKAEDNFGKTSYTAYENTSFAFDHACIIASALDTLKKEAENFRFAFDFLPEKFTLNALQNVHEALTGNTLIAANFRRKAADFVEETEDYTEGAGHRPARLFRKKI